MGNSQQRQQRKKEKLANFEIEEAQQQHRLAENAFLTFLVLGCKSSGKATLFNQLKNLYGNGWNEEERRESIYFIVERTLRVLVHLQKRAGQKHRRNLDNQLQELIHFVEKLLEKGPQHSESKKDDPPITEEQKDDCDLHHFLSIFESEPVKQLLVEEKDILDDDDVYYMEKVAHIWAKDYFPTDEDMIRLNVPVCGVREYDIEYKGVKYRFLDPGGAVGGCICCTKMEPKKWLHHFEGVTALVYCADLCAYKKLRTPPGDIYLCLANELPDDLIALVIEYASPKHDNQAAVDLNVWEEVANRCWFRWINTPIVFLTNETNFHNQSFEDFTEYFPDLSGYDYDGYSDEQYVKEVWNMYNKRKFCYNIQGDVNDTQRMEIILNNFVEIALRSTLKSCGL